MFGTIVNCTCIIGGCLIGLLLKGKLSDKISSTIMNGLALCALYIGISGALKGEDTLQIQQKKKIQAKFLLRKDLLQQAYYFVLELWL